MLVIAEIEISKDQSMHTKILNHAGWVEFYDDNDDERFWILEADYKKLIELNQIK